MSWKIVNKTGRIVRFVEVILDSEMESNKCKQIVSGYFQNKDNSKI